VSKLEEQIQRGKAQGAKNVLSGHLDRLIRENTENGVLARAQKAGGLRTKELGVGLFGMSRQQLVENGERVGKTGLGGCATRDQKAGIHGLSVEETKKNHSLGGKVSGAQNAENGTLEFALHTRWHVLRDRAKESKYCRFCDDRGSAYA
jgi:hypothetical protein